MLAVCSGSCSEKSFIRTRGDMGYARSTLASVGTRSHGDYFGFS